ncbi:four-helix bundle copper-binding protein [Variovorax sp. RT4R15]|uniref:four-helix bundle copper-binding protein n=1 Tax=Variovorax sp. RT4R15 TaxID=3443737 RepID=UPI003F48BA34
MHRRDGMFVPLAGFPVTRLKETDMPHKQYAQCIDVCNACATACNHCAASCLREDDVQMMAKCIALDIDCTAICQLAAAAMARESFRQACFFRHAVRYRT